MVGTLCAGFTAAGLAGAGTAHAAGSGISLTAVDNKNCTATFTLTNHTNSTCYQPDWWFAQEANEAWINAGANDTSLPVTAPWRYVSGVPWPVARWVGSPSLHSGVAEGIPVFPGNTYKSNAQPEGYVTTGTINLKTVTNPAPPKPARNHTQTIYHRVKTGPVTADRLPTPVKLVVTGCKKSSGNGSLDWGSSTGSLEGILPR